MHHRLLHLCISYILLIVNSSGEQGSISLTKDSKMVLDASLLSSQHYKVWIKGKWSIPGKEVEPSSTPWCSSYWKGSRQVDLENCQMIYLLIIYILTIIMLIESKVLKNFHNMRQNLATLDAFATGLWDTKLTKYSPSATPKIGLYG